MHDGLSGPGQVSHQAASQGCKLLGYSNGVCKKGDGADIVLRLVMLRLYFRECEMVLQ
jgi:hypothetical protein